ncbi:MAG: hypothetical protein VX294_04650 [Candidatus Latescibacterota bacterium]|nr:hypothetical protein [Candidatus Latescibacterota bacterium]
MLSIGDLVKSQLSGTTGVVIGFNEKGEGGKDFVHVLVEGDIHVYMSFDLHIIKAKEKDI